MSTIHKLGIFSEPSTSSGHHGQDASAITSASYSIEIAVTVEVDAYLHAFVVLKAVRPFADQLRSTAS